MKKKARKTPKAQPKKKKRDWQTRKPSKLSNLNIKINGKDLREMQASAKRHAKGSLSAWVRHAGLKYRPKKGESIQTKGYK